MYEGQFIDQVEALETYYPEEYVIEQREEDEACDE